MHSFAQNGEKEFYSFGGHVFSGFLPITYGEAHLYSANNPDEILEIATIDTLGYYFFYKIQAGHYYIKAGVLPGDPNFSKFSYTFYPSGLIWQDGSAIDLNQDYWEYDISLINQENEAIGDGFGKISGSIQLDGTKPQIDQIDVILMNEFMEPVYHIPTNSIGQFSFENLNIGKYIVYPQLFGYETEPVHIEITDQSSQFENIKITIKNGTISSYINEAIVLENSFKCFPNPAHHSLNLSFNFNGSHHIQTRVVDIAGRLILETSSEYTLHQFNTQLSTIYWNNGFYFVEVFVDGTKAISQKVAVLH
jgi:hypothetical protein